MKSRSSKSFAISLLALALIVLCIIGAPFISPVHGQKPLKDTDDLAYTGKVKIIRCSHLFDITTIENKKFNQPSAVDVFKDRIIVLDGVNGRVAVFNNQGAPLFQFGKPGSDPGEFKSAMGLAVDSEGRIYVADSGNHRIQIFDQNGKLIDYFKLREDKYGFRADPTDLAVDQANNQLLIVDNDNHRLLVYTPSGKFIREIGKVGFEDGQFRYPYSITIDEDGLFYVVDVVNTRVQVFNDKGDFIRSIGEWGIEKGQFFRPQGIGVDSKGRIYVTGNYIGVIQVFSKDGSFLALLGNKSRKKLKFSVPTDLSFDNQGRIYICEMYDSRISVYQIED